MSNRYAIETLDLEDEPVIFIIPGVGEVPGFVRFRRRKPKYFAVRGKTSVEIKNRPSFWRPANQWPEALPAPAVEFPTASPSQSSVGCSTIAPSEHVVIDWDKWPNPEVSLGHPPNAPQSVEEAAARVLRCLRTDDVITAPCQRKRRHAWPQDLRDGIEIIERALGSAKDWSFLIPQDAFNDFHVDKSSLEAIEPRFDPTKRDIADSDAFILTEWGHVLTRKQWSLFVYRALRYSWREIARCEGAHHDTLHKRYQKAKAVLFEEARTWNSP